METKPRPDDLIRKLLEELEVRFLTLFGVSFFSPFSVFSPRRRAWSSLRDDARYEDVPPLLLLLLVSFLSFSRTRRDGRKNIKAPQVAFD